MGRRTPSTAKVAQVDSRGGRVPNEKPEERGGDEPAYGRHVAGAGGDRRERERNETHCAERSNETVGAVEEIKGIDAPEKPQERDKVEERT